MKQIIFSLIALIISIVQLNAQKFEEEKLNPAGFKKLHVQIGADFAIQYQGLNHTADSSLVPLGKNINLPTANLNLSADLAPGIRINVITYLSSRHHPDAWVKGGYLLFDHLPFVNSNLLDKVMDVVTLKMGVMELNYGDAHFRRSDNGKVITNPFAGNYIMDAFTTAPAIETMVRI